MFSEMVKEVHQDWSLFHTLEIKCLNLLSIHLAIQVTPPKALQLVAW